MSRVEEDSSNDWLKDVTESLGHFNRIEGHNLLLVDQPKVHGKDLSCRFGRGPVQPVLLWGLNLQLKSRVVAKELLSTLLYLNRNHSCSTSLKAFRPRAIVKLLSDSIVRDSSQVVRYFTKFRCVENVRLTISTCSYDFIKENKLSAVIHHSTSSL